MTTKPELILHIGMGKTGTTALQEAFWANRGALQAAGILYPTIGAVSAAHHLITPFVPKALAGNGWTFLAPQDWAPKLAASGAKRILMSSELIAWSAPDVAASFCAALTPYFDLKICLYLRRQDNIIMAGYNQQIKAGNQVNPIAKVLDRLIATFDFATTIQTWERAAGAQNLIVRPYERSQFPDGDLIADFLTGVLGIAVPDGFQPLPAANSNPRFSHVALEYKRLINCVSADAATSGEYTPALMAFSQLHDEASRAVFFEQGLLSPQDRARILEHFAAQNAEIAQKFLGRDVLFTDALAEDAALAPPVTPQDLAALSDWLMQHHKRLATRLVDAAAKAKAQKRPAIKQAGQTLLTSFGTAGAQAEVPKTGAKAQAAKNAAAPQAQGRRVILHPGQPKTGTTSLQEAFFKNRKTLLADHGILYPRIDENHTQAILALFRDDALNNIRFAQMSAAELASYRAEVRAKLEAEIARDDWHTLLISGEGICTLKADGWAALVAWLNGLGLTRIEVIFSVRDGMDMVRSAVQQNLKSGMLLEDLYAQPPVMRCRARLMPIIETLGKPAIQLWDFDQARRSDRGLLHHFCASLQLAPEVCTLIARTEVFKNESLSQAGVDALAARNRQMAKPTGVTGVEHALYLSLKGPKFTLPPEVAAKVQRATDQDARWLAKAFPKARAKTSAGGPVLAGPQSPPGGADLNARPTALAAPPSLRARVTTLGLRFANFARNGRAGFAPLAKVAAQSDQREIIIHFGTRKTGTSSIQQTLFDAGDRLPDMAYVHGKLANSSLMVRNAFLSMDRLGKKLSEDEEILQAHETGKSVVMAAMNRAARRSNRLILSAEVISDFNPAEIDTMAQTLASFATQHRFVGYVRDPASYARSVFQQIVKTSLPNFSEIAGERPKAWTYFQIVDRLDARFGRDAVHAFAFDRGGFLNGDVVPHFLQEIGLDPAGIQVKRVNESLSMLAVKLLYVYRKSPLAAKAGGQTPRSRLGFLLALEGLKGPGFAFHTLVEHRIEAHNQALFDWAEKRLDRPLPRVSNQDDRGIRVEGDLLQLTSAELAQFADFAAGFGVTDISSQSETQDIAAAMHKIRQSFTAKR